jgi:hypothetical protein
MTYIKCESFREISKNKSVSGACPGSSIIYGI